MGSTVKEYAAIAVISGLCLLVFLQHMDVRQLQGELAHAVKAARSAELNAMNWEARADSTRLVAGGWERLAEQEKIRADSLDEALSRRPVVYTEVEVQLPPDTIEVTSKTDSTLTFEDEVIRISARLIPEPPIVLYELKPIPLSVRVSCGTADALTGVAGADVRITSPAGRVEVTQATLDPGVCSPKPAPDPPSRLRWFLNGAGSAILTLAALAIIF